MGVQPRRLFAFLNHDPLWRRHDKRCYDLHEREAGRAYLKVAVETLRNYRIKGNAGPKFFKLGGRIVYRVEDLEQFMRERALHKTGNKDAGVLLVNAT